jgi:hypothetical protein
MTERTVPNNSVTAELLQQILDAHATALNVGNLIVQGLEPLRIVRDSVGHPARMRELSVAITELEGGVLWLAQYRRELEEAAAAVRRQFQTVEEG